MHCNQRRVCLGVRCTWTRRGFAGCCSGAGMQHVRLCLCVPCFCHAVEGRGSRFALYVQCVRSCWCVVCPAGRHPCTVCCPRPLPRFAPPPTEGGNMLPGPKAPAHCRNFTPASFNVLRVGTRAASHKCNGHAAEGRRPWGALRAAQDSRPPPPLSRATGKVR